MCSRGAIAIGHFIYCFIFNVLLLIMVNCYILQSEIERMIFFWNVTYTYVLLFCLTIEPLYRFPEITLAQVIFSTVIDELGSIVWKVVWKDYFHWFLLSAILRSVFFTCIHHYLHAIVVINRTILGTTIKHERTSIQMTNVS